MKMATDYRSRIYESYASSFQGVDLCFDGGAAKRWGRNYETYLRGWLPQDKGAAILDVACGGGYLLHFLKSKGYANLSGIDISNEQVGLARQVCEEVIEGDVLDYLSYTSERYDLIIGLDIVEHFGKNEVIPFLEGCGRALNPGGRIILQTPNANSPWGAMYRYGDFSHEVIYNPKVLSHLMQIAGFGDPEAREAGPVVQGIKSAVRYGLWKMMRLAVKAGHYIETGGSGGSILTRAFLISGNKQHY